MERNAVKDVTFLGGENLENAIRMEDAKCGEMSPNVVNETLNAA